MKTSNDELKISNKKNTDILRSDFKAEIKQIMKYIRDYSKNLDNFHSHMEGLKTDMKKSTDTFKHKRTAKCKLLFVYFLQW